MGVLEIGDVSRVLGGKKSVRQELKSHFDFIALGSRGLSKHALIKLADYLQLSLGKMAQLLSISERTIQRYEDRALFGRAVSEHLLQIATIAVGGTELFGEKEAFLLWLNQPCVAFGNEVPIDLLQSRFGIEMVQEELGRMAHGVFA